MDKNDKVLAKYIPKNLDECFVWLDRFVVDKEEMLKDSEDRIVAMSHHGLGMTLRNNWRLWEKSPLTDFFNGLGIQHADDMSGIIIRSYYRKAVGKEIDMEGQVKEYKKYWKKNP